MKHMRKIMALVIAMVMMLSMSISVFAENYNITVKTATGDTETHTFDVYQIFAGVSNLSTESDPKDPTIGTITWGSSVTDSADFITELKAAFPSNAKISALATDATAGVVAGAIGTLNATKDSDDAKALAAFMGSYFTEDSTITGSGNGDVTISVPGDGYYFIKDHSNPDVADNDKVGASTRFILEVVGDTTITVKASVPSVSKFVDDENDSTDAEDTIDWVKTADYDINDVIPYHIKGTLPSNYADYARYNYIFHDTMGAGLTYDTTLGAAKVVLYENEAAYQADVTAKKGYANNTGTPITDYFTANFANQELTVSVNDFATTGADKLGLKNIAAITKDSVIVVYYYAKITGDAVVYGNPGNPNDVYLEFSNNPNANGEGETGETPKDTNVVFTYKVEVDKVDENLAALKGAAFALFKKIAAPTEAQTTAALTDLTANGVTLTEGTTVYKTGSDYYLLIKNWATNTAGNIFAYSGIDDGDYLVSETVVPDGYNKVADVTFSVSASAKTDTNSSTGYVLDAFTVTSETFKGSDVGAAVTVTEGSNSYIVAEDAAKAARAAGVIKNQSGATLPETGGIGTTIFYILGAILVLGAGIVLVTRRRMRAN